MKNLISNILKKLSNNVIKHIINPIAYKVENLLIILMGYENYKYKLLEYSYKIKRSKNCICKILKKFLSQYDWFNNNIIKF